MTDFQSNMAENFTWLFITLECWNANPKTWNMLDWKSKTPHLCQNNPKLGLLPHVGLFNASKIVLDFSIQHFSSHRIVSLFHVSILFLGSVLNLPCHFPYEMWWLKEYVAMRQAMKHLKQRLMHLNNLDWPGLLVDVSEMVGSI